jgi:hypothetical protein
MGWGYGTVKNRSILKDVGPLIHSGFGAAYVCNETLFFFSRIL